MRKIDLIIEAVKTIWSENTKPEPLNYFDKHIAALDKRILSESAEKYGTPQYILDRDQLEKRALYFTSTFRSKIRNVEFFYAFKCNDLPYVVKTLKDCGLQADVAGLFELQLAHKLGFKKIIFTSPGKSEEEIELAIKKSSRTVINIDNFDEIAAIKKFMKKRKVRKDVMVSLRINPDTSVTKNWSKFGFRLTDIGKAFEQLKKRPSLKLVGLHFHSSWNRTSERQVKKIEILGEYLKANFPKEASRLKFLDLGGGIFPEDVAVLHKYTYKGDLYSVAREYSEKLSEKRRTGFEPNDFIVRQVQPLEEYASDIAEALSKHIYPLNKNIKIYMEPGRFLATHSTSILLRVVAVKKNAVIVDGGVNMVGDYRFEESTYAPIVNITNPSLKYNKTIIYGPLCDPSDIWGYSYFGSTLKKGDVIAVMHQGAYTFSCAWRFIKPTARYIAFHGDDIVIAKDEEKFNQRYAGCKFR